MSVRKWWMIWGDLATKLLAIGSSFASLAGLLVSGLEAISQPLTACRRKPAR
jgi:hypothetical protein